MCEKDWSKKVPILCLKMSFTYQSVALHGIKSYAQVQVEAINIREAFVRSRCQRRSTDVYRRQMSLTSTGTK